MCDDIAMLLNTYAWEIFRKKKKHISLLHVYQSMYACIECECKFISIHKHWVISEFHIVSLIFFFVCVKLKYYTATLLNYFKVQSSI